MTFSANVSVPEQLKKFPQFASSLATMREELAATPQYEGYEPEQIPVDNAQLALYVAKSFSREELYYNHEKVKNNPWRKALFPEALTWPFEKMKKRFQISPDQDSNPKHKFFSPEYGSLDKNGQQYALTGDTIEFPVCTLQNLKDLANSQEKIAGMDEKLEKILTDGLDAMRKYVPEDHLVKEFPVLIEAAFGKDYNHQQTLAQNRSRMNASEVTDSPAKKKGFDLMMVTTDRPKPPGN